MMSAPLVIHVLKGASFFSGISISKSVRNTCHWYVYNTVTVKCFFCFTDSNLPRDCSLFTLSPMQFSAIFMAAT